MKKAKKILMTVLCAVLLVCISVGATLAYLADTTEPVQNTFTVGNVSFDEELNGGLDEVKSNNLGVADQTVARVTENDYKLMPGITYAKDPTIHLDPESEPCYVRAMVTVTNFSKVAAVVKDLVGDDTLSNLDVAAKMTDVVYGYNFDVWEAAAHDITFGNDDTVTYEFRVKRIVVTGTGKTYNGEAITATENTAVFMVEEDVSEYTNSATTAFDINLFDKIVMPDNLTDEHLEGLQEMKINIEAHAIQAEGFKDTVAEDGTVTKTAMESAWEAFDAQ